LEFVKRSGATVLGHDECVQSVLDLRLAVKAAVGIHVCKEVIFKLFKKTNPKKTPVRLQSGQIISTTMMKERTECKPSATIPRPGLQLMFI
jgi:hypothetical protein